MKKYHIERFPKNKEVDISLLSEPQRAIRNNQKVYRYGKSKTCYRCLKKYPIKEFWFHSKKTGRRRSVCRDCELKRLGVVEIGRTRFAINIADKGFRKCSTCREIKILSDFFANKNLFKGRANNCKKCAAKLSHECSVKSRKSIGDSYLKEYGKRKGITVFNKRILEDLRVEIEEKRKPKYFLDGRGFPSARSFAVYVEKNYGNSVQAVLIRLSKGKTEKECTIPNSEVVSEASSRGKVKVTDLVTGEIFIFKNSVDKSLLKMFSPNTISVRLNRGGATASHRTKRYPNPCIIERILK